ncbi:MAG TPA: glutathione S-transferase family protein [Allosphingosinicella sp.]|nr:glutathione S-transferase family protein [Allosphingosinicella sp.]
MTTILYYASGSCSLAAHWALIEAEAQFDLIAVNLGSGEQRSPEFLSVNPHGRVPVLLDDGQIITELPAILYHVASNAPGAGLLNLDDPRSAARSVELMAWFSSTVQISFSQIFRPERFADSDEAKASLKRDGRARVLGHFKEIESLMAAGRQWLVGDSFSVLDPYAFVFLNWASRLEIDAMDFPAWHAHAERMMRRPSAAKLVAAEGWTPSIPNLHAAA